MLYTWYKIRLLMISFVTSTFIMFKTVNMPMEVYTTKRQTHFIAPIWSTEKVPVPISEMTDGDLHTCASTTQGKHWIFLMSSDSKRIIPTNFTVKMKSEAGKKYMHPYLWVNLGEVYDIEMVEVVNRADYGPERLNGLALYVKNAQPSNDQSYFNSGKCNALFREAAGGAYVFPCFGSGSYVVAYIQTPQPTYLTICEIEVYSKMPINLALNAWISAGFLAVKDIQYLADGSTTGQASELMFIVQNTSNVNVHLPGHKYYNIKSVKIYSTVDILVLKVGTGHKSNRACAENVQLRALPHVNTIQCESGIVSNAVDVVFQNPGVTAGIKEIEVYGKETNAPIP